jgi:hypothetical protein
VLTWDRTTGWADLARFERGAEQLTFIGFREIPADDADHLGRALAHVGLRVLHEYAVDKDRVQFTIAGPLHLAPEGSAHTPGTLASTPTTRQ